MTLYTALVTLAKIAAPMIPFMSEEIYRNLVCDIDKTAPESVHLCSYPAVNEAWIDAELEADMEEIVDVVVLGRAARNGSNIKNRQPIATMYVKAEKELNDFYVEIIREELNIKNVVFTKDVSAFTAYNFKPQLRTLGPKYGKRLGEIRNALANVNGAEAKASLDATGKMELNLGADTIVLETEDLLIETSQMEGFFSVEDKGVVVAIDTTLTPELIEEGYVNEVISKIQTMRKDAKFNVTDHIEVAVTGNELIANVVMKNAEEIQKVVLGETIRTEAMDGVSKEWNINGETVTLTVKVVG